MKKPQHEFWITNIEPKRDVMLADLRLTIRAGQSRNLLDSRHYSYTLEELQKSAESGSLKAKSHFIKVRENKPVPIIAPGLYVSKVGRTFQLRNKVEIVIPTYEELNVDGNNGIKEVQEKFAADEADIADDDVAPALPVDVKFTKKHDDE